MSVGTFSCVRSGYRRSIVPEVVYQRVVVQVATTCNLAELAISPGGRCRARGTCVRVDIFVRTERNLSVDRARGGLSETCRTSRLHLQLSRMGEFSRRKVSSTWYMCPCGHFRAYGEEFVGRSRPRWSIRDLSYKSSPPATYPSGRFRLAEGVEHVVHVPVCTFSCVRSGDRRSIKHKVVYQRVVVQVVSTCNLAEWAISPGGRCRARCTCVRVDILLRMEWNLSVDRARGGLSESCRTSRHHLQLSRVGDFTRRKVSSTWYMCPCGHFVAYGVEFVGRSRPRWCIRDLSYKLPPATT